MVFNQMPSKNTTLQNNEANEMQFHLHIVT